MLFGSLMNRVECRGHLGIQPLVHQLLRPVVAVGVLHHLEIGDRDPAGVAQEVGNHVDARTLQDPVGLGRGRAVGQLDDDLCPEVCCVLFGDHTLQRRRNQHGDLQLKQRLVANCLGAWELYDRASLFLVRQHRLELQTIAVVDPATRVRYSHHFQAKQLGAKFVGERAGVAVALNGCGGALQLDPQNLAGLPQAIDPAAGGGVATAGRSAECQGFAGDDSKLVVPLQEGVFVDHPGHDLRVRVHVWSGHVLLETDDPAYLANVGAAQPFELAI